MWHGRATSGRCDAGPLHRARGHRRPGAAERRQHATTAGSATGSPRSAGRCTSTPSPTAALARALARIPDGAVVLLDGLIASPAPEALVPEADRLRQVVLLHMPLGDARARGARGGGRRRGDERLDPAPAGGALRAAPRTWPSPASTPPSWRRAPRPATRCCASRRSRPARATTCCSTGWRRSRDLPWRCTCVGQPRPRPGVRRAGAASGAARVRFTGPRTGAELDRAYAAADLLVLPRARRPTAWSSPRRWPAASRCSPPTSAA